MITFDKLKLVTSIHDIKIIDHSKFNEVIKDNQVCCLKYYQDYPYNLLIKVDIQKAETVIEFTGKILHSAYPKHISTITITKCFENINSLGICSIDIGKVIDHCQVVKCDVVKDIKGVNIDNLSAYIRSHISNYQFYNCNHLSNKNLIIEKNVTSSKLKKRMTIYDKDKEMKRSVNRKYAEKYGIANAFENCIRAEMNLNSKDQIRKTLHIDDTQLIKVLESTANPIFDFLQEVVSTDSAIHTGNLQTYMKYLLLKECDFDLAKIEAIVRASYKRGTSIKKIMESYRAILSQIPEVAKPSEDYRKFISQLQ